MKTLPMAQPEPQTTSTAQETSATAQFADVVADPARTAELRPAILDAIATVFDPEIPVNIWELGLIYDIEIDGDRRVHIRMTLTAPACPAAQALPIEVERAVRAVEGVADATVEVVWDPAWSVDRMSDSAKLQLGFL
jgi:FeS assembly SUF system protein